MKSTNKSSISKEEKLIQVIEDTLNDFSFNEKNFADAISTMHPAMQQSLYRLIRQCLFVMADNERIYDERNIASHKEAMLICSILDKDKIIPFI